MRESLSQNSADIQKMWDKTIQQRKFTFDFDTPDFPEEAAEQFEQLQNRHEGERTAFLQQFKQELSEKKEEFFAKNHYETKKTPEGKEEVVLHDGKPKVEKGPENAAQRVARQAYEMALKSEMFKAHNEEKQQFVKEQKQQLMTFLEDNKFQLTSQGVQNELAKLIMEGQKKALKLQDDHEEEYYKLDLPTNEMKQLVDERMGQYKQMKQQQAWTEENSPQARKLAQYQLDLVALLDAKRAEVRDEKRKELFLLDKKHMMEGPPKQDLVTVLPMNMVAALELYDIVDISG